MQQAHFRRRRRQQHINAAAKMAQHGGFDRSTGICERCQRNRRISQITRQHHPLIVQRRRVSLAIHQQVQALRLLDAQRPEAIRQRPGACRTQRFFIDDAKQGNRASRIARLARQDAALLDHLIALRIEGGQILALYRLAAHRRRRHTG